MLLPLKNSIFKLCLITLLLIHCEVYASNLDNNEISQSLNNKTLKQLFVNKEEVNFYMFVSLGLSDNTLKQILEYAKLYNGVIVLRGIEDNSFVKTSDHIQKIAKEDSQTAIIIDPTLFKKYQVSQVPTYVLAKSSKCPVGMNCGLNYDRITGNITPRFALEKFSEKGDLSNEAQILLERNK